MVRRVLDDDSELLCFLEARSLRTGTEVQALAYSAFDQNLSVRADHREPVMLGKHVTQRVLVEELT